MHVSAGVQQPLGELAAGGEVGRSPTACLRRVPARRNSAAAASPPRRRSLGWRDQSGDHRPAHLVPLDAEAISQSVRKTGKLLIVHEAPAQAGAGAEILRQVLPHVFGDLQASPQVLGGADVAMPYSPPLEDACIPQPADIARVAREMVRG